MLLCCGVGLYVHQLHAMRILHPRGVGSKKEDGPETAERRSQQDLPSRVNVERRTLVEGQG